MEAEKVTKKMNGDICPLDWKRTSVKISVQCFILYVRGEET